MCGQNCFSNEWSSGNERRAFKVAVAGGNIESVAHRTVGMRQITPAVLPFSAASTFAYRLATHCFPSWVTRR